MGVSIGRTGDMEYGRGEVPIEAGSNGIVIISRSEKELFKPETLASFEGKPFTIKHPEDFVDAKNWKDLAKGIIQNVRRGEGEQKDDLVADILVTDVDAISLIENGVRQLSCGYEAEYFETGKGTGEQKNIVGNHLALVEEGRAGDTYKINDQKGVNNMNKKLDAILKKLLGKTADQIMKDEEAKEKAEKSKDAVAMDELVAMCDKMAEAIKKIGQPNDEKPVVEKKKEEAPAKDEEVNAPLEERLKALEAAVAKLLERESKEDEVPVADEDEEEEVVMDEDEEESEDAKGEFELTGDEKSKKEILAPGLVATKDFKVQALKQAYKTEDGKKSIDSVTGGKPDFASVDMVNILFNAIPEMLKTERNGQVAKTKKTTDYNSSIFAEGNEVMTAEKMNELNNKFYNKKQ